MKIYLCENILEWFAFQWSKPQNRLQSMYQQKWEVFLPLSCRKKEAIQEEPDVYVKKPPNAFMIFLKEQRRLVAPELKASGSMATTAYLGSMASVFLCHIGKDKLWKSNWRSEYGTSLSLSLTSIRCLRITVLCPQWKSLPSSEKEKYYKESEKQKLLHKEQNPDWSPKDNYVSLQRPSKVLVRSHPS